MLSYQHIYHAGNFADVQKHAILARLVQLLSQKPQKFSVLDTHAGRGLYDLTSAEAQKIGEFNSGILPFWQTRTEKSPLSDYLKIVSHYNSGDALEIYPGSAKIAHRLMRETDSLTLIERHPGEFTELQNCFKNAKNVKIEQKDGFQCLINNVPFAERRGLMLVDPSYEIKTEYADLPRQLRQAHKKWPQGQFMIWYPMIGAVSAPKSISGPERPGAVSAPKSISGPERPGAVSAPKSISGPERPGAVSAPKSISGPERPGAGLHHRMLTALRNTDIKDMLVSEIILDAPPQESFGLYGSGVIIINPPFGFETALNEITAFIAQHLPVKAKSSVFWLNNRQINPETGMLAL